MTQFLPPNLLALFAPRDPIPFLPPACRLPHEKKATHNYQGIAQYVHLFEDPIDTPPLTEVASSSCSLGSVDDTFIIRGESRNAS